MKFSRRLGFVEGLSGEVGGGELFIGEEDIVASYTAPESMHEEQLWPTGPDSSQMGQ